MKKEKVSSKKREQIIDSTIKLMQKVGFEDSTIRMICDVANISIGTFYHYFNDKQDLLNAILKRIDTYLTEEVEPTLTDENELENLLKFAAAFAQDTKQTGSIYGGIISTSLIPLPNTPEEIRKERLRPLYHLPAAIIKRGQEKNQFSRDFEPEELADKLIMSLRGCAMEWARRNYHYDIEAYIADYLRMFSKILY